MHDTAMLTEPLLHPNLLTASQRRLLSGVITRRQSITQALTNEAHYARQDKILKSCQQLSLIFWLHEIQSAQNKTRSSRSHVHHLNLTLTWSGGRCTTSILRPHTSIQFVKQQWAEIKTGTVPCLYFMSAKLWLKHSLRFHVNTAYPRG